MYSTTFKNIFQYQTSKFNKEKPQLLLHQPNKSQPPNNINTFNKQQLNWKNPSLTHLQSNLRPARDAGRVQTKPCAQENGGKGAVTPHTHTGDWARPASECVRVSCGSPGQQLPAAGTGALTADLGGAASGRSPPGGGHHETSHR